MAFARLERDAWTDPTVAAAYDALWRGFVAPSVPPLLEAAQVGPGDSVLDVAAGPGTVGRAIEARGALVLALDFSSAMLFSAGPDLPRVRADSARLPFRDKSFDRVVCNLGLLHFPDPDAAVREAARAVKPGGVVAFSVWAPDAEALTVVPKSLQALGLAPSTANAPGFFRFGEPGEFEATIRGAGLVPLPTARFAWNGPVEGPESLWRMFRTGSARTRAAILSLPETDQQRLRDEVVRRAETFRVGGRTLVPTAVVIGRGRRP